MQLITASCPRCGTNYNVPTTYLGKPLRCPNPSCHFVFVVGQEATQAPSSSPAITPDRTRQQSGHATGGDLVPFLKAEDVPGAGESAPPASSPPSGGKRRSEHVSDLLPLVQAEDATPDLPLETTRDSWSAPPPVRKGPGKLPAPDPAPAAEPPLDLHLETTGPSWLEPPPVRGKAHESKPAPAPEPPSPPPPPAEEPPPGPRTRGARSKPAPRAPEERPAARTEEWGTHGGRLLAPHWEEAPPPVRQGAEAESPSTFTAEPEASPPAEESIPTHAPRTRRLKWVVATFCVLVAAGLAFGGWKVYQILRVTEAGLADQAKEAYDSGQYGTAVQRYDEVIKLYPDSENKPKYKFLRDLAELRRRVAEKPEDPTDVRNYIDQFLEDHEKASPTLLNEYAGDVATATTDLLVEFAQRSTEKPNDATPLKTLEDANSTVERVARLNKGKAFAAGQREKLEEATTKLRVAIARASQRRDIVERLKKLATPPMSWARIKKVQHLLHDSEADFPGLEKADDVAPILAGMYEKHREGVLYVAEPVKAAAARPGEGEPAILIDSLLQGAPGKGRGADSLVLAVCRGVLYGLRRSNGHVKWAMRVGIDTTSLPVRVPPGPDGRERILVVSSDTNILTALDTDGNTLWRYRLDSACLGRPTVIEQRAYLPTVDGQVHEIELAEGKLLGRFVLGQRLTLGGTPEPGTRRIYFPADDSCVYVLDTARKKCETVLYTGHPAGSLRSELVVVAPGARAAIEGIPRFLILNQAQGLHATVLRVYDLPLTDRFQPARVLEPQAGIQGYTWFAPWHDPEKLVLLSDAGQLGLFGIRQARNRDQALFPMVGGRGIDLSRFLPAASVAGRRERAEVVEAGGEDLWVLTRGRLQRLRLGWDMKQGRTLTPGWRKPLELGSPLHASQVVEEALAGNALLSSTIFLVTRPAGTEACWVTAVNDETGEVYWKRQLGLVAQADPLPLAVAGGGNPVLVTLDQAGSVFALDPDRYPPREGALWQTHSQERPLAPGLPDNPDEPPVLLPSSDGKSVYAVSTPGDGTELVVREVKPGKAGREVEVSEGRVKLPMKLAGTPAVMGKQLVVPLSAGSANYLARVLLPVAAKAELERGPDWALRASNDTRCVVVAVGEDTFLASDGGRAINSYRWPADGDWERRPPGLERDAPALELKDRVVALVRLPSAAGSPVHVVAADSAGVLHLLHVEKDGRLVQKRTWDLKGRLPGAVFVRKDAAGKARLGCVVEGSTLVWIDPEKGGEVWHYSTTSGEAVVGEPVLAGDFVVVADRSGAYVALAAATGKPAGPGYHLSGTVVPASAPVPFDAGRLLAPLSDGTVMLLSLDRLENPLRKFPTAW